MGRKKDTKRRKYIIDVSAKLFKEKGYQVASMRELAQCVGVEVSSLYNHIDSKHEVLSHICSTISYKFMIGINEISEKKVSYLHKLEDVIRLHLRIMSEDLYKLSVTMSEWRNLDTKELKKFVVDRNNYEYTVRSFFDGGIKNGEFKDMNLDVAVFSLLSCIRWTYDWYSKKSIVSIEELEKEFIKILLHGYVA